MTITYRILGKPGLDNALFVTVDSGKSLHRVLFDCGQGVLDELDQFEIQRIDALCFSHFHFDHYAGFDSFLRHVWCRPEKPVRIFGPPDTCRIIHHRLQGFLWNNAMGLPGEFLISETDDKRLRTIRLLTTERFVTAHEVDERPITDSLFNNEVFSISACTLDHGTDSLAYVLREHALQNVEVDAVAAIGLRPGSWIKILKDTTVSDQTRIEVEGREFRVGVLREQVIRRSPGDSIGYLTDFRIDDPRCAQRLVDMLGGCRTLVCENNYGNAEQDKAIKNFHMTSAEVGELATRVNPDRLVIFHLSDRYRQCDWLEQLRQVRDVFPRTEFPAHWVIDADETMTQSISMP